MKHTRKMAHMIMRELKELGIKTKLIGSIESKGVSENDIDLVLLDYAIIDDELILRIQSQFPINTFQITNWGGVFIKTPKYNIDLFPNSYMKKCYDCIVKCCL